MKIEVLFEGNSLDVEFYEGERVFWEHHEGQLHIYTGEERVASYPEGRVVRVRRIDAD